MWSAHGACPRQDPNFWGQGPYKDLKASSQTDGELKELPRDPSEPRATNDTNCPHVIHPFRVLEVIIGSDPWHVPK